MMEKLKPCPFCGSEARVQTAAMFRNCYSIVCMNTKCGAHVFFYGAEATKNMTAKHWNRRERCADEE